MSHHFHFPTTTLVYNASLIAAAAQEHPAVTGRLPAGYITDTAALISKITTDIAGQKTKKGDYGTLTQTQHDNLDKLQSWITKARKTASLAFKGQAVKLHEQFQVGVHTPADLPSILNRADIIIASLQNAGNVPALTLKGWSAADTTAFAAARATFPTSTVSQQNARTDSIASTQVKDTDADDLYERLLTIQNAVDLEWPVEDAANAAIRTAFRLGIFPPATHAAPVVPPPAPAPSPV